MQSRNFESGVVTKHLQNMATAPRSDGDEGDVVGHPEPRDDWRRAAGSGRGQRGRQGGARGAAQHGLGRPEEELQSLRRILHEVGGRRQRGRQTGVGQYRFALTYKRLY